MSYLSHLTTAIGNRATVTDEVNFNYDGVGEAVVIKYLGGAIYNDSIIQPVSITVYTSDIKDTKAFYDTFTRTYSNVPYTDGVSGYVNVIYSTPMLLMNPLAFGDNFTAQFLISVTLVISADVSDIKSVTIDSVLYETTNRVLTYATIVDNQRLSGNYINTTEVQIAMVKFSCNMISKSGTLGTKIRNIRTGVSDSNTTFTILLTYTDNAVTETYTMKLDSSNINSDNSLLPVLSLSFIQ